jgi:hypothetical protein
MLRIYKSYQLPYRIGGTGGNAALPVPSVLMTFSSYPALPFSLDDFYQTSSGMVRAAGVEGGTTVIVAVTSNSLCRSSLKRLFPTTTAAFGSGCRPTRCWIGRATWLPTGLPAAGASGWTSTRCTTAAREYICHALLCRPWS